LKFTRGIEEEEVASFHVEEERVGGLVRGMKHEHILFVHSPCRFRIIPIPALRFSSIDGLAETDFIYG
jgi:hypothetical protein